MTLNRHFALNSVLRRYVWSAEAWLSKLGYSWTNCSECRRRNLNRKEQLRHRAVSLRQHGFLLISVDMRCLRQLTTRLGGVVVRASELWSSDCEFDSRPVHCRVAQPTQPSIPPGRVNRLPAYWLGLRRGAFTCVGWQVTLAWSHVAGDAP